MARIRTIKPELLEDEKTASLSDLDWRLFVSCLLLADDYGNFRSEPGLVGGKALWGTEHKTPDISAAILRLEELGLLSSYSVRGQNYLHICSWSKHQRIDKPGKPSVPGPDDPEKTETRIWWTYFLRLGDSGPIKIGKSVNVAKRIAAMQTAAPEKLNILRSVPVNVETACHRKFHHLRSHGEWFTPTSELLDFIEKEPFENDSRMEMAPFAPDLDLDRSGKGGDPAGARPIHGATEPEQQTVAAMGMAKAFAEERAAVLGGFEWNVRAGDPAKEADRARQLDEAGIAPAAVRASMRRFWQAVKSGQQADAQKCSDKATFAMGAWFDGAKADLERAAGVAPVIAAQARGSPVAADPYASLPRIGAHGAIKS